ncbi:ABC transporter permease [Cohnella massiliensis]|uniref:ABC transporter permease n=1 Tax=Cohnella massiliensis TaxID=1816691 RepID=UPI0009BB8000|nr:ABC transporter permease [Cohnella massiliensis]
MLPFLKKDFLVYWRDRKEMALSLLLPIVLIVVLSLALPNWVENGAESLDMDVAIVREDDEEAGLRQFRDSLASSRLAEEEAGALAARAEQLQPAMLLMQLLEGEEVGQFVKTTESDAETAARQLEDNEISAILTIPEGYTLAALNRMLLGEGEAMPLALTAADSSLEVDVLRDIVEGFMKTLNFELALSHASADHAGAGAPDVPVSVGGRETIEGFQMITSFQYYSLSITIVFALFVAMTTATKAITEKRERVFQRILLSGSPPFRYLAGKIGSTFVMSLLQMTAVFALCHFALRLFPGRSPQFWLGMATIALVFCFSIASLSAVFTALAFRYKESSANGAMIIVIMVTGTIGGSFVPVYILPDWLRDVGEWTPNGLSLAVFIQWVQQEAISVIAIPLLQLILFSVVAIAAGLLLFPKRGRI